MTATIDQFKALLAEFKKLTPTLQRDPTTLELSGYPHRENVYSNILAFFLDPGREHGFGSLFLESLLSVAGYEEIQDGGEVEVNREEITGTRKRIDIVISTDTLIVGIENKIYHPLHNDLEDYGQHLTKKAKANGNERRVYKILLGLNFPNDDQELSGFEPVTYESYFGEILRRVGPMLIGSKDRYLRFALEMFETAKHLTEGSAMDSAMLDFFKDNEEGVLALSREVNNLKEYMRTQVKALMGILDISDSQNRRINLYPYRERNAFFDSLVHDITIEDGFVLTIEACISLKGWKIEVFPRHGKGNPPRRENSQRVKSWLERQKRTWKEEDTSSYRKRRLDLPAALPYDADIEIVAAQVRPLLESAMTDPFPKPQ